MRKQIKPAHSWRLRLGRRWLVVAPGIDHHDARLVLERQVFKILSTFAWSDLVVADDHLDGLPRSVGDLVDWYLLLQVSIEA